MTASLYNAQAERIIKEWSSKYPKLRIDVLEGGGVVPHLIIRFYLDNFEEIPAAQRQEIAETVGPKVVMPLRYMGCPTIIQKDAKMPSGRFKRR